MIKISHIFLLQKKYFKKTFKRNRQTASSNKNDRINDAPSKLENSNNNSDERLPLGVIRHKPE